MRWSCTLLALALCVSCADAPSVQQVVAILELRCGGGCHQHQGSDGFVSDGRLRPALLGGR